MKAAVFLFLLCASAQAYACVSYEGTTTLTGTLTRHTFPEEPNYESMARGDAAANYFFVKPRFPICVNEGKNGIDLEPAVPSVIAIQLVFLDGKTSYRGMRPYLGRQVVCRGSLYAAHNGHHHSPVLLLNAKCQPTRHVQTLDRRQKSIDCQALAKRTETVPGDFHPPVEARVIGHKQLPLHLAPHSACRTPTQHANPGDYVTVYAIQNGWANVMFIQKGGEDWYGWIPAHRLELLDQYGHTP